MHLWRRETHLTVRHHRLTPSRRVRMMVITVFSIALGLLASATLAYAQQTAPSFAALESSRAALDQLETTLKQDRLSTDELIELGRVIVPIRDDLISKITDLGPRLAEIETRLQQLGVAPAADAPPEPPTLAAERAQLIKNFTALDAEIKQARLLALRANQLAQTITKRRYTAYAGELFTRSWSILDPSFWIQASEALIGDTRHVVELFVTWRQFIASESSTGRIAGAVLMLAIIAVSAIVGLRRWRQWTTPAHPASRFGKAARSLWAMVRRATFEPLLVLVAVQVVKGSGLLPVQFNDIANGLVIAVALGAFGCGVATGVMAPHEPERRLLVIDDNTARVLSQHLVAAARLVMVFAFFDVVQKHIYSPPILIGFASVLFALAMVVVMLHLLFAMRATTTEADERKMPDHAWIRGIAWLVTTAIAVSLLAGYARLAGFLSERLLATAIIVGAFYVLIVFSDALFADAFTAETRRGRAIAANLGLQPRRISLIGALMSGVARLVLLLLAVRLILGPWEGTTGDLADALKGLSFAFTLGEATISLKAMLVALAVLIAGIFLTRLARHWLESSILRHTDLEPSLQLSVGIIFGYAGIIVSIMVALGALGIDLQKIALVAGALSVGIGFGLQSIVSNFVSGLILLTERPIRVGDWIVIKGEEGFVRRIRVRATEVETFERASVIIPNSELISGLVKNWTHGNILGRVSVKVGVSYNSDPEQVRDSLLEVAAEHPFVLKEPAPFVLLMAFGDNALEFELRCIVRDIQQRLIIQSELNYAVLARFRKAGIDIPFPQRTIHIAGDATYRPGS